MTATSCLLFTFCIVIITNKSGNECLNSTLSESSTSSIEDILNQKNFGEIYNKLNEMQFIEDDLILFLNEQELDKITTELNITSIEKYRLKALIRKIKYEKKLHAKHLIIEYATNYKKNLYTDSKTTRLHIDEQKIELQVHSHRGHKKEGKNGDPQCLLQGNNSRYYSENYWSFGQYEDDWIIFKWRDKNKFYLPNKLYVRNWSGSDNTGVKTLSVSIGDPSRYEWITFNPIDITLHNIRTDPQMIKIDGINPQLIRDKKYQHIRLLLKENHGGWLWISPKYVLIGIELHGVEIASLSVINSD